MQTARLLVFTLLVVILIIAPAPAQSPLPSEEMLREVRDEINSTTGSTATSALPISLPDTPVPLPGDKVIRKLWWAYPAAMMAIHIKNGVGSIRTQAPSCPVAECQGP